MFGKTHDLFALNKISKPGSKNPMLNRKHTIDIIKKMSISRSKDPLGLYDFNPDFCYPLIFAFLIIPLLPPDFIFII
jgi:hypothetical protein